MTIHPKTSGAAVGSALGILIVSVLSTVHGVNLTPAADAAIPSFLSTLGAWLVPASDTPAPVVAAPTVPAPAPAAPAPAVVSSPPTPPASGANPVT